MAAITTTSAGRWVVAAMLAQLMAGAVAAGRAAAAERTLLDGFETLDGWTTMASDGARVWITQEPGRSGMGMRIGFDLEAGGGWVLVRKTFSLTLPENYAFTFGLRGEARPNNFEFKLLEPGGKNVWWRNQRAYAFPTTWQQVTIRKSRIAFAWGSPRHGELKQVGAIEFAISAGEGGSGSVWIDELAFEEREATSHEGVVPVAQASSALPGHEPALMLDGDPATAWRSEPEPRAQWVTVDLGRNLEYGGLVIDWEPDDYATAYEVQVSNDGTQWSTAHATASGHGGRDYIYMPDAESRFIRLDLQDSSRGQGYGIVALTVKPASFSASPNDFFGAIARDAPLGTYPKYFSGRQTYWTVVGVNGDGKEALLNEEGMLEVDKGAFSIEPFVWADGRLLTWNAVHTGQALEDGYLPIPSVTWEEERLALTVTAFASGKPGASTLYARYRLENRSDRTEPVRLFLAIRPFQVNPPWQTIHATGGVTHIQQLRFDGRVVWVNRDRAVASLTAPAGFGGATFEEGGVTDFLLAGRLPGHLEVSDPFGFASGALSYDLRLEPRGHAEVDLAVPLHEPQVAPLVGLSADDSRALVAAEHEVTRRYWETVLGRVEFQLPDEAEKLVRTLRSNVAYMLINRDGAALQPGPRNYARSWIRDGAMISAALLAMGFTEEVRDYLRWFVRFQAPNGKVPCCVDRRGPDPVVENDSPGELIYAVMEYYRYTHDVGFLSDMWPHVIRAADYLATLRRKRMTDEYRTPDKEAFYGLLPESISHEGYAAYPVHAYWDDFFALRGLKDAAEMARVVGDDERADRFAGLRDAFRGSLYGSLVRSMRQHGIDYIPGSVELGDFDPTSTSIAIAPGGELGNLPEPALTRTFDRYWQDVEQRRRGETDAEGYSPYELRNVTTFVQLGERQRALELLDLLVADQRPAAWNEWAEISWRDPTAPRFIGDMPHTWVGSGFVAALRSLFAYEREADHALVLGAGLRPEWVMSATGVGVKRLPTYYGILNYSLRGDGPDAVRLRLSGDVTVPPGNIVVQSPLARPLRAVTVNGRPLATFAPDRAVVRECPAEVVLGY